MRVKIVHNKYVIKKMQKGSQKREAYLFMKYGVEQGVFAMKIKNHTDQTTHPLMTMPLRVMGVANIQEVVNKIRLQSHLRIADMNKILGGMTFL